MLSSYTVSPLARQHDRTQFSCGYEILDRYLSKQASQDIKRRVAAVFVLTEQRNSVVKGYYTLSATSVLLHELPKTLQKKLPKYPSLPATLIGRLAVDKTVQGKGVGEKLLVDALIRAYQHSQDIGSIAIVVDAIDEQAKRFYLHYDFLAFDGYDQKLFLPMLEVKKLCRISR